MLKNGTHPISHDNEAYHNTLTALANEPLNLKIEFATDPARASRYQIEVGDLFLDYSKNLINDPILSTLIAWAEQAALPDYITRLVQGAPLNTTEQRAACYTALRISEDDNISPYRAEVLSERQKMLAVVRAFQAGQWLGSTQKPLKTVVNIGIGGSDLGPKMACEALRPFHQPGLAAHFISNGDPTEWQLLAPQLDPETVLFVISSKSFQTAETMMNAQAAYAWLQQQLPHHNLSAHFVAVTAASDRVADLPCRCRAQFKIWDWVGGRFSVWSSVGLPLAMMIGEQHFCDFLAGARQLDHHFQTAPLAQNMPVIMALLTAWYTHYKGMHHTAVIPYQQRLNTLPSFLQQLVMESNGKSMTRAGHHSPIATSPVIWGGIGSNSQHAFHQYLHQGMHSGAIDFIAVANGLQAEDEQYLYLLAQCVSQAEVLMSGHEGQHSDSLPGNRPSNFLLLQQLNPKALGMLIALYEHQVFAQSILWGLNAFDQPGVEQGKRLAQKHFEDLKAQHLTIDTDASTRQVLNKCLAWRPSVCPKAAAKTKNKAR